MVISVLMLQAVSKMKTFLRAKYPGDIESIGVVFHTPSGERLSASFSLDAPLKVCKSTSFFNTQRVCAARATVVVLCVCLSVCLLPF